MEYYEQVIKDTLEELVEEGYETKEEILKRWSEGDTRDDFGNITGSRECSRYKAEEALKKAGFPFNEELNEVLINVGYDLSIINNGPEVVDVILCELIAPMVAFEMLEA